MSCYTKYESNNKIGDLSLSKIAGDNVVDIINEITNRINSLTSENYFKIRTIFDLESTDISRFKDAWAIYDLKDSRLKTVLNGEIEYLDKVMNTTILDGASENVLGNEISTSTSNGSLNIEVDNGINVTTLNLGSERSELISKEIKLVSSSLNLNDSIVIENDIINLKKKVNLDVQLDNHNITDNISVMLINGKQAYDNFESFKGEYDAKKDKIIYSNKQYQGHSVEELLSLVASKFNEIGGL